MTELIWDFNDFMSRDFESISMGLTPSGHLHLGFLTTLACALMYLKEHPNTHLIITNIENSLSAKLDKYNSLPLRFQFIEQKGVLVPSDYSNLKKRNAVIHSVHEELINLIWELVGMFDERTASEKKALREAFIVPSHKRWLELKEHKIFHLFHSQIYIYSFLRVLEKDVKFRNELLRNISNFEFAKVSGTLCGITATLKNFGNQIKIGSKIYRPTSFKVPLVLYCSNCHALCPEWVVVVLGHPYHNGPTLAAECKNYGHCPRADKKPGYDGYVYHNLKDSLDMAEFHFMLDPIRDFYQPFKADCHVFGGDYFQLEYEQSGMKAIEKIKMIFDYMEHKTGQQKYLFGGPLITVNGRKMSKTGQAFNLNDIKNIKQVFLNVVEFLEESRSKSFSNGLQIEYTQLLRRVKTKN